MGKIIEYRINQADSGVAPAQLVDMSGGNRNATINYDTDGGAWASDANGRYLTVTDPAGTTPFNARVAMSVGGLGAALEGRQIFVVTFRMRNMQLGMYPMSTLIDIGEPGQPSDFRVDVADAGNGGAIFVTLNGVEIGYFYSRTAKAFSIEVDTTLEAAADRIKVYRRDAADTNERIAPIPGYVAPAQNSALTGVNDANTYLTLLNNRNLNASVQGGLGYFRVDDAVFTQAQTFAMFDNLAANDDADPHVVPTLTFASAPAIDQIAATTARLQLTTSLAASVKILQTAAGSAQPAAGAFDAVSAIGTTTAYTVFQHNITGLSPETSYRYWVQITDGTTTLYASADVTTLALSNAILSINGGQPIREGQTGIIVTRESGATGTTATTLNGVAQASHTVNSDTESQFDWVWPNLLYGQGGTVNIDGVTAQSPPVLPPVGSSYVTLGAAYSPATPGAITAFPEAVAGDQIGYETQGGAVTIDELGRPTFTSAFNGSLVCWMIDSADGSRSANATIPYDAPADIIPTQFDLGADATNQEPGAYIVRSFVVAGVDAGADVPFNATGAAQVSDDNATWGNATTQQLSGTVYMRIPVPALGQPANVGGVSSGGVSDSISVAVRAATVPTGITPAQPASVTQGAQASFTIAGTGIATVEWSVNGTVDPSQTGLTFTTTQNTPGAYTIGWVARSAEGGAAPQGTTTLTVIAAATRLQIPEIKNPITGTVRSNQQIPVRVFGVSGNTRTQRLATTITTAASGGTQLDSNQIGAIGEQVEIEYLGTDGTWVGQTLTVQAAS